MKYTDATLSNNITLTFKSENCTEPQVITNIFDFSVCYTYFATEYLGKTIGLLLLAFLITISNVIVIVSLSVQTSSQSVIFDEILIGYCIVNGITGLIDMPLTHFSYVFQYWPLGSTLGEIAVIMDNGLATVTLLHMAYLSFVRMEAVKLPGTFKHNFIIRRPIIVMPILWICGFLYWTIVVLSFGLVDYSISINYQPAKIQLLFSFIGWFLPIGVIMGLAIYLIVLLRRFSATRQKMKPSTSRGYINRDLCDFHLHLHLRRPLNRISSLDAETRFQILIFTFLVQWLVSNIITVVQPFCECIPQWMIEMCFFLTYLVCLTDAILILLLNSNINICQQIKNAV